MAGQIDRVEVNAGSSSYPVFVGWNLLESLGARINPGAYDHIVCIVSNRVAELHKNKLETFFNTTESIKPVYFEDGESNKNYLHADSFFNRFLHMGLTRKSLVVGIGGGVVGDFAGFLAALYMRGIALVHVPTTLLAMVDSSIGGKVAVNVAAGKNIVGAFHQPSCVISDLDFLQTLPDAEFSNGLAESLKHGLIGDSASLDLFEQHEPESLKKSDVLQQLVYHSVCFKAGVVAKDETEKGLRAILNFGHTLAHAVESAMNYKGIRHGEAVAVGLAVAADLSVACGLLDRSSAQQVHRLLQKHHLGQFTPPCTTDEALDHMKYDKKNSNGNINFVMLKEIGEPLFNQPVTETMLRPVLGRYLKD